jgi:acyl-[acyl-carrier-protein] desaturase
VANYTLIPSLEPKLRELYDIHMERAAKVDWAYSDFIPLEHYERNPESIPQFSPTLLSAIELALFTEVNLPWFTSTLNTVFKGTWTCLLDFLYTWTAEEDAHSLLLEVYLYLTRNGDPRARAALRKQVMRAGVLGADTLNEPLKALVYTSIQERATQVYYLNLARAAEAEDPQLARVLRRLAKDETLHYSFYRDCVKLHLETDPNSVYPVADILLNFEMPGHGSPGYVERANVARIAGIYGPEQFFTQVINSVLEYWEIDKLHPTYAETREAQQKILKHQKRLATLAARLGQRREKEGVPTNGNGTHTN